MGSDPLLAWRSAPLGLYLVGCIQTTLLYGPSCSVRSGVTAMITEARYSDDLRPALAYVNDQPERTSRWPERWMIYRADGSFALYLVNRATPAAGNFQPCVMRIPEWIVRQVLTAFSYPQPVNEASRFLELLHQRAPHSVIWRRRND